jgi:hypothetical protein
VKTIDHLSNQFLDSNRCLLNDYKTVILLFLLIGWILYWVLLRLSTSVGQKKTHHQVFFWGSFRFWDLCIFCLEKLKIRFYNHTKQYQLYNQIRSLQDIEHTRMYYYISLIKYGYIRDVRKENLLCLSIWKKLSSEKIENICLQFTILECLG